MAIEISVTYGHIDDAPRDLADAHDYWRQQTPEGAIGPSWANYDLLRIPAGLLPYAIVADCRATLGEFVYRYWGSGLTDVVGEDYTGKRLDEVRVRHQMQSERTYEHVLKTRAPVFMRYDAKKPDQSLAFQSSLRLPLSYDGETVANIVSLYHFPWTRAEIARGVVREILNF